MQCQYFHPNVPSFAQSKHEFDHYNILMIHVLPDHLLNFLMFLSLYAIPIHIHIHIHVLFHDSIITLLHSLKYKPP